MTDNSREDDPVSPPGDREVDGDGLREAVTEAVTRRQVLGTLGIAGAAGLVGQWSLSDPKPAVSTSDLRIADDGAAITDATAMLNFGRNLRTNVDGDQVTVAARRGLDVAGAGGDTTRVSALELGPGLDASVEDGTLTLSRAGAGSADRDGQPNEQQTAAPPADRQMGASGEAYVAQPGDLQASLDDAAVDGRSQVRLANRARYEFRNPVEVPPGLTLDCTGAGIDVRADVNAFELHTQSQVYNPQVRTTNIDGYSSSVFHVNPEQFGASFGSNRPVPVWTVSGGWSEMTPGEGTCIELHGSRQQQSGEYDAGEHNHNVYFCFVSHNCIGGHRFAHLHREGGETTRGGHVNGNIIKGFAYNTTRFVETDDSTGAGKNMVNGNKFYLTTQPDSETEWLWYANKGRGNELYEWGTNWDYADYADHDGDGYGEAWFIGPNAGTNFLWRRQGSASGGLGSTVVDESDGDSGSKYVLLDELGTAVDQLDVWDDAE